MKLLYKYYRWRAKRAPELDKPKWKLKAYRHSNSYRRNAVGRDVTFDEDAWTVKYDRPDEPLKFPHRLAVHTDDNHPEAGARYRVGPAKYKEHEDGRIEDVSDWRDTPKWWAGVKEANQQHMPTFRSAHNRGPIVKFDPKTGKRTYWKYDYKTGQQVEVK